MTEDYDPSDDRYVSNPFYEPEFDAEGDDGPPLYVQEYRAAIDRYKERCAHAALRVQRHGVHL